MTESYIFCNFVLQIGGNSATPTFNICKVMTQSDLISTLRTLCRTHVERENGNLALVYGDLLIDLPIIISPHRMEGEEFYVAIRPTGFECCLTEHSLRDRVSLFTKQTMQLYCIKVHRIGSSKLLTYGISFISTYINR